MGSSPLAETPPKVRARLVFQGEVVGVLTTHTEIGVATSKTAPVHQNATTIHGKGRFSFGILQ